MAHRFSGPGMPYEGLTRSSRRGPKWTGRVTLVREALREPLGWRQPRVVFVNSMSDLFHEAVPAEFIAAVFDAMADADRHTFQILTKRADRLAELAPTLSWPRNVWMGVSVESAAYAWRIDRLRQTNAAIKFLSLEPLLGPLPRLDLKVIDWVIVGGESGPGARPMEIGWVRDIREQCARACVPFFFKQWGGVLKKARGRVLDGRTYDEMPRSRGAIDEGRRRVALPLRG